MRHDRQRFGKTKEFGLLGSASLDFNGRGIDNIQPKIDLNRPSPSPSTTTTPSASTATTALVMASPAARTTASTTTTASTRTPFTPNYRTMATSGTTRRSQSDSAAGVLTVPLRRPHLLRSLYLNKRPNANVGTVILGGRSIHATSTLTYQISASRGLEQDSAGNPKADFAWVGPTISSATTRLPV